MHYIVKKGEFDITMQQNNQRDAEGVKGWYQTIGLRIKHTQKLLNYINKINDTNYELDGYSRYI